MVYYMLLGEVSMIHRRFILAELELDILCYFSTRSPKCLACRKNTYIIPYRICNGGTEYTECQSPLAGRLNWLPHPVHRKRVCPSHLGSKWGGTHTRLWEGGGSQFIRRDRHYSTLYSSPFSLNWGIENNYIFQYQHRIHISHEFLSNEQIFS
jgi:hypothetical protein